MIQLGRTCRAGTLVLGTWVSILLFALPSAADSYKPPEFLLGVRAGDGYEEVLSQQGWYECSSGIRHFRTLCFDRVSTLGETGTYRIKFLDGYAFSGDLRFRDVGAMERMVGRLPEWRGGVRTLAYIHTENTEIDVIKAVHDLGREAAVERFSRYLTKDGRRNLMRITVVPLEPPAERQFADAESYLDSLPPGGVVISLWKLNRNISAGFSGATMLSITLPKADRKELFPQYCDEGCANWSIPETKQD